MEKSSTEQRLQILEAKETIKDITYQYAWCVNQGWNGITITPEALRSIFTEDVTWESPFMNIKVGGIEGIIKSLVTETQSLLFAMHCYANPIIKIEGTTGTGNWLFWVISKTEKDKTNQVFMSQDIAYLNTSDGWRIKSVKLHFGDIVSNIK